MTVATDYLGVASALVALVAAFALGRRIDNLSDHLLGLRQLVSTVQETQSEQRRILAELNLLQKALPDLQELGRQLAQARNRQIDLADSVSVAKLSTELGMMQAMEASVAQMKDEQVRIVEMLEDWRADFRSAATELAKLEPLMR